MSDRPLLRLCTLIAAITALPAAAAPHGDSRAFDAELALHVPARPEQSLWLRQQWLSAPKSMAASIDPAAATKAATRDADLNHEAAQIDVWLRLNAGTPPPEQWRRNAERRLALSGAAKSTGSWSAQGLGIVNANTTPRASKGSIPLGALSSRCRR